MENVDIKKTLQYSIITLVLGILSISMCWADCCTPMLFFLYPPFGIVLGYLGKRFAVKGFEMVAISPTAYSGTYMLRTGKILSIIGFIAGIVSFALGILFVIFMLCGVYDMSVLDLW
jgi:hypothetical protein